MNPLPLPRDYVDCRSGRSNRRGGHGVQPVTGRAAGDGGRAGGHALVFILITVFVDTIGFGIIIPVVPALILELTGEELSGAARYGGSLMFVFAFMQFIFAPVMGGLSDRFGRRPVLLLSLLALAGNYLLMGLAPTISWLFAGRLLAGIFAATHSTANAFVADVSPAEDRARNFGRIGAVWSVGFAVGPMIGGLLGDIGPRVPFFAAAALAVANVLYGAFVLPETLPAEKRRPFSFGRANPFGALLHLSGKTGFVGMFAALMLYAIAHDANPATWTYYTMEKFGWSARDVGLSLGGFGVAMGVVQAGMVGPIVERFGERRAARSGFALMAVAFLGFAWASQSWMMYACIFPFALGTVGMPALRSMMAARVSESEQGELAGAISSIMAVMAIPAPIMMTQLFSFFTSATTPVYFPGASFLAASLLMLASAVSVSAAAKRLTAAAS
jgi:DHA1 family tetracycline resistance protein-like MFS transporter